ncbi:YeeE/YedE thiosulfate transporter family protein [Boseongicola aestuarii]|uniref:Uncharacterized protein n=1 Tax=Boseongicola aestuarii TaxID=1470561 RepID=A0A238IVG6_9RHOB|nr:hypothetical protein BOA8489_00039 [Boseongicola aestuarii]
MQEGAAAFGLLELDATRALLATGSVSGAILGRALFGIGMNLARGCASRLLVLAASGNLRALVAGLVVTLVAQASYRGALSPLREELSALWTIPGGESRNLGAFFGLITALLHLSRLDCLRRLLCLPVPRVWALADRGRRVCRHCSDA